MMEIKAEPGQEKNILTFQDKHPSTDPIFEYPDSLCTGSLPLIIDNGSNKCQAGWLTDETPRLVFKNIIAKQRSKKTPDTIDIQIGNDIGNVEVVRWQLKSQFDRNIVTQYDTQEQIFDYIFSHLGITTSSNVDHPIVMTEPLCNPNYCRQNMSELLFECYHVPSVAYGVDSMFSFYKNHQSPESATALVLSCGFNTTHVMPIVDGHLRSQQCRRINVGGSNLETFLQKILQLKYPGHTMHITPSRAEEILHTHCRMAKDYGEELSRWANEDYYLDHVMKYQLPYTAPQTSQVPQDTQKKEEKRDLQIRRLKDLNAKKRDEKLAAEQEKLDELLSLYELYEDEDDDTFHRALQEHGITSAEELQDTLTKLSTSIQRARYKILMESSEKDIGSNLIGIPDEMLAPDQQELKRRQKLMAAIGGSGESQAKKFKSGRMQEIEGLSKDPEGMNNWVVDLRKERQELLDCRAERKQRRSDMTKRRTQASLQRMKIITELARGSRKKKEDTFGQNDDDWNVYKEINKDAGDSDSEAEQEKIEEIESLLREYDPKFKDPNQPVVDQQVDMMEYYRIHVGVEQIRVPELLFQPSMIGTDQAGVSETIEFVLSKFSSEEQTRLVQNVFLTGGCSTFPGFKNRLETDLLSMRPFQSTFKVNIAENPVLDAWYGAQQWARSPAFKTHLITKADYDEKGGEYLKEFWASNSYVPTPIIPSKSPVKASPLKVSPLLPTVIEES